MLAQLAHDLVDLVYPPKCVCCAASTQKSHFCADCSAQLSMLEAAATCPRCAAPLGDGSTCPYCGGEGISPFASIVALGPFRDPLRKLIHQLKFRHRWPVAEVLADRLLAQKRVAVMLEQTDCLIAMPLHWARQIGRGYNQAESLATRLSKRCGIHLVHPLVRLKNTPAQTTVVSRAQRSENVRNAFGLAHPRAIRGRRVTIVDDVMTTAATLKSAASTLKDAEPTSISALVLAVADPRRRDFQVV